MYVVIDISVKGNGIFGCRNMEFLYHSYRARFGRTVEVSGKLTYWEGKRILKFGDVMDFCTVTMGGDHIWRKRHLVKIVRLKR